jgi:hypothetical protein
MKSIWISSTQLLNSLGLPLYTRSGKRYRHWLLCFHRCLSEPYFILASDGRPLSFISTVNLRSLGFVFTENNAECARLRQSELNMRSLNSAHLSNNKLRQWKITLQHLLETLFQASWENKIRTGRCQLYSA